MKILIAIPTFETIYPDTFKSVYELETGGHEVTWDFVRGYDCATARNRIAQKGIDLGADYVLMIDNDVVVPKDALIHLTEHNEGTVLGYYAHRGDDNLYSGRTCVCKLFNEQGAKYFNYPLESEYTGKELRDLREAGTYKLQIHGGGMGCALIRVDLFRKIRYPWFDWVNYADDNRGMLSEDLYFCENLKRLRIPIYTDTRVACGHILRHIQWPD